MRKFWEKKEPHTKEKKKDLELEELRKQLEETRILMTSANAMTGLNPNYQVGTITTSGTNASPPHYGSIQPLQPVQQNWLNPGQAPSFSFQPDLTSTQFLKQLNTLSSFIESIAVEVAELRREVLKLVSENDPKKKKYNRKSKRL